MSAVVIRLGQFYSRIGNWSPGDLYGFKVPAYATMRLSPYHEGDSGTLPPGMRIIPGNNNFSNISGTPTSVGRYSGVAYYFNNNIIAIPNPNDVQSCNECLFNESPSLGAVPMSCGQKDSCWRPPDDISPVFDITVVGNPVIQPNQKFSGIVGFSFNCRPVLADSIYRPASYWSAVGLPGWASINPGTGEITGTPQQFGNLTFTVSASGPGGAGSASITISVGEIGGTFEGKVGVAFSHVPSLTGAWVLTSGALPSGLSINSATGAITGTPTKAGNFFASISFSKNGETQLGYVSIVILSGVPIITAGQILSFARGMASARGLLISDSVNRPVFSWAASGLPSWATLDSATGRVSGEPGYSANESTSVTFTATGPGGTSAAVNVNIKAVSPLLLYFSNFSLNLGDQISFSALEGSLPSGVVSGIYYYLIAKKDNKFAFSLIDGGDPVITTGQWAGRYVAKFKKRICRGGISDVGYIGLKKDNAKWNSKINCISFWGYPLEAASEKARLESGKLLSSMDFEPSDFTATDWVITVPSGYSAPSRNPSGSPATDEATVHYFDKNYYIANWRSSGVLADINSSTGSEFKLSGAVIGDMAISSNYNGNIEIYTTCSGGGNRADFNLFDFYIKFFNSHSDIEISSYRRGGGKVAGRIGSDGISGTSAIDGWFNIINIDTPAFAIGPVLGPYLMYKIVKAMGVDEEVSVGLKIKLIK